MYGSKVIAGEFIKALRKTAQVFHTTEEPFNQIALTIKSFIIGFWLKCICTVGDNRDCAIINNSLPV